MSSLALLHLSDVSTYQISKVGLLTMNGLTDVTR